MDKFSMYQENVNDSEDSDGCGTIYELEIQSESSFDDESVGIANEIILAGKDEDLEMEQTDNLILPCEDNIQVKKEGEELSECKSLSIKTEEVWIDDGCDNNEGSSDTDRENVDDDSDDSDGCGTIYELEIQSESSIVDESVGIANEIFPADKDEDLELEQTDNLILPREDNIQVKKESEELSECKSLSIKTEEVWIDDSCGNNEISSDTDMNEKYSEINEQMKFTYASNMKRQSIIFRKVLKIVPDYLHINSKEKNINIELLQLFKLKPHIWNHNQIKFRKPYDFQKEYESIAKDINEKFSINVSWKFVKNRIDKMRFICCDEMEKELSGEEFQMPWFFEHMEYLKQNLNIIVYQRRRYKQKITEKINESALLIVIELYKKYEELWQINNIFFYISSKRTEAYNKMLDELKSDYNIKFKLRQLKDYINYTHRVFIEDKTRQIKSEIDKSDFSPASKYYDKLTFLKDSQGPFKCPHCNDIIQKFRSYLIHVAEHTNSPPFKCVLCERQYRKYMSFKAHIRLHVGLKKKHVNIKRSFYECDICNKSFFLKKSLDNHKLAHNYHCSICDTGFECSSTYDEHMRSHEKGEDNVQIKEEDKELSDCEFLSIGDEDESFSQMTHSTASNSENKDNKFRKRLKCVPDYLLINSKEKNINIALLQLFELKPYIWNYNQRKFRKGNDFQNDYESIAKDINSKFSINVSWEFVKNRINEMRYTCIDEIEKELNGEEFQMPWYFEHMIYLKQNLIFGAKQRILYKQSRIIDESILLIVIKLYKKHEVLWQVNNPYFGIFSKITEAYNKILGELKSDYNIKFKLKYLKHYVNYIHRIYSEDKERELNSELDKSEFSPASKHYDKLTFLKDSRGPFKCPHCNIIIQNFESYHIHVAEHTNTIPFKCNFCKSQYKHYVEYIRHIRYHIHEIKSSYQCDICNKCFAWKNRLDKHKLSHKYQCQICDASFERSKAYDEHMRRHEKGLRLECHICKKGFDKLPLLKNHLKCHPNVPHYLCNICGKGFTTYIKFRYHKHRDRKYCKCDICGKIYTGKSNLATHLIKKHNLYPKKN